MKIGITGPNLKKKKRIKMQQKIHNKQCTEEIT